MGFATPHAAFPAELTNGNGKKVCVVQSWEYSKTFGKLRVDFDANGDVTSCSGKPQFVYDSTSFLQNLVDAAGEDYTEAFDDAKKPPWLLTSIRSTTGTLLLLTPLLRRRSRRTKRKWTYSRRKRLRTCPKISASNAFPVKDALRYVKRRLSHSSQKGSFTAKTPIFAFGG